MALWRVEEAAEYLGIRPKTLYEWVRLDRVPYRKIGFNVRFDPDELRCWTEEQSRGAGTGRGANKSSAPDNRVTGKKKKKKPAASTRGGAAQSPETPQADLLVRLAGDASRALRDLERDVGTSLSFPQRRKLLDLAQRLDDAASQAREP